MQDWLTYDDLLNMQRVEGREDQKKIEVCRELLVTCPSLQNTNQSGRYCGRTFVRQRYCFVIHFPHMRYNQNVAVLILSVKRR